ncbi:Uncharacterised protein [Fluoribacter dumoffii]|uniref:Uncharacterized protein n=1 Tax=Fluoribacter dumoffii TaxID=463 RepID=A0A377G5R1_9GAMM|nr:Uncharacterised protein [Fluoribacter dumoffii]
MRLYLTPSHRYTRNHPTTYFLAAKIIMRGLRIGSNYETINFTSHRY